MNKYFIAIFTMLLLILSANSRAEMNELPLELRLMVFKNTSIRELLSFCAASKANNELCSENEKPLWQELVKRDFGEAHTSKDTSSDAPWKKIYIDTDEVFFGRYVKIAGGKYEIGSPPDEKDRNSKEDIHEIELSDFEIMKSVVTQAQYVKKMGANPSCFQTEKDCPDSFRKIVVHEKEIPVCANYPVENVAWFQAQAFAYALSKESTKFNYSLPTEARLEVAFRGGKKTAYSFGDDASLLKNYVRYFENSDNHTWPVNSLEPNDVGIHRGAGVWEWTGTLYASNYSGLVGLDPVGLDSGSYCVLRGDGWKSNAQGCRSAYRSNDIGFRLVRTRK